MALPSLRSIRLLSDLSSAAHLLAGLLVVMSVATDMA